MPANEEPPPYPAGFIVLPRRWVIERTIAWIMRNRRMSRDYEFLAETTEALIYVAMIRLMLRRLATHRGAGLRVRCTRPLTSASQSRGSKNGRYR